MTERIGSGRFKRVGGRCEPTAGVSNDLWLPSRGFEAAFVQGSPYGCVKAQGLFEPAERRSFAKQVFRERNLSGTAVHSVSRQML